MILGICYQQLTQMQAKFGYHTEFTKPNLGLQKGYEMQHIHKNYRGSLVSC